MSRTDDERDPQGGGASRSTDPAAGSSAATDVSLREYTSRDLWWLDRHTRTELENMRRLVEAQRASDQEAIRTAFSASQMLAEKHNDLIRQMERKDSTYATQQEVTRLAAWQARITGGLILVGFLGVANLVKVWTG